MEVGGPKIDLIFVLKLIQINQKLEYRVYCTATSHIDINEDVGCVLWHPLVLPVFKCLSCSARQ
jgi:hypothetical protein